MKLTQDIQKIVSLTMTDKTQEALKMAIEQLEIVRFNLYKGMSKSIQKAQSRAIKETLDEIEYILENKND